MFNQQDFIARLQRLMEYNELSASALADHLGVPRSSISHLLSERNKPSLDFVLRIIDKYPEVDLYWLLYGDGNFPKEEKKEKLVNTTLINTEIPFPNMDEISSKKRENKEIIKASTPDKITKRIQKIIFFYTDKSFEIFENL
ncbi:MULTISPECIES: helix-turn-helix domain-containing protein [unclassified Capnocytophaga]|jgi:Bacteriophage CI repressor helix-turn-helix domain.|uniref:helix-turn-helix domain-containing protein n=1 Tax=unclassified Capnocytophaga TaxID=2640652 RepID=UPI000202FB7B|nr:MULTISPECIES: helix-turn-helix domain-containing protein [unclassified Capnocytophaga]EGD34367.1 HTH_3 family transcriptional regulator protein [Capnocytophaga sp. oral taxon 338 str. F0234]MEB3004410.1 helix-turn-helix domain-containing protein [Capnocytophaga sp. G2]